MADRYFEKLPLVVYSNTVCRDISRRAAIVALTPRQSPFMYYPYAIKDALRPDHIAEYYYEDSEVDWLIYLQNQMIDPYYGWPLDDNDFEQYIIDTYGSSAIAQRKVYLYRNNWPGDLSEISVSYYNNNIAQSLKKYYEPVWGPGVKIISYRRKRIDTSMNTNQIIEYTISSNSGSVGFSSGDLVDIKLTGFDQSVANGEVAYGNSTVVALQNVSGNTTANSTLIKDIVSVSGTANVSANLSTVVYENFTTAEGVFWSPVSYYQYESELNEQRKQIVLADKSQTQQLIDTFEIVIQQQTDPITRFSIDATDR